MAGPGGVARPLAGDGLVAQEGELSLVCAAPDAVTAALVDGLLAALEQVAAGGGDGPALVRRAARVLAAQHGNRPLACALAGPAGRTGFAVLVSGDAAARVMLADGREVRIGGDPHGAADRVVEGPVASLELTLPGAGRAEPRLRLGSGVTRGGGLRRSVRRPAGDSAARADQPAAGGPRAVAPEQLRTMLDEAAPQERVSLIRKQPKRRPGGPPVLGVNCKNEHFNDPRAHYCAVCGISMLQLTLLPFRGPRPPLGVLLLDDGQTVPLEDDQLIGRLPDRAPEVTDGRAHPLRMADAEESISRRHALVRLEEWQVNVVDLGSANGTAVRGPGETEFVRLAPDAPLELAPGATVRVGLARTLRFESNRKI